MATTEDLGLQLEAARKQAAGILAPGLAQEKRAPGSIAAHKSRIAGLNIQGLQDMYAQAVGNPGAARMTPRYGVAVAAVPANAPLVAPIDGSTTGGWSKFVGSWGAKSQSPAPAPVAPAPDMAFAPGASRGMYEGTAGAPAVVAAPVGPNIVTGGLDPAASRLLSAARTTYAESPDTGLFAKDWAPLRDQYQVGGGTWLGRTAADDANTARQAKIEAAYAKIGTAKTVPGQKAATDAFNILMTANTARETNEATTRAARAGQQVQAQIAADKIMMSLYGPEAMKQMSEAQIQQMRAQIAAQFLAQGDLAGAGAATGGRAVTPERWGIPQNYMGDIKPGGAVPMQSTRGAVEMRTVKPVLVTDVNIQAYMRDNPRATRAQAIEAHRAKGLDVSGLK